MNDGIVRTGAFRHKTLIIDNRIVGTGADTRLEYYSSGSSLVLGDLKDRKSVV